MGRTMRILDSRGQELETRPPIGWRGLLAPLEWAPNRKGAVPLWKTFLVMAAYAVSGFLLVFLYALCSKHVRASLGQLVAVGAMAAGLILILRGVIRAMLVRRPAATCGGCGYDLHGLQPQEDGCRVCPECGGAWRD